MIAFIINVECRGASQEVCGAECKHQMEPLQGGSPMYPLPGDCLLQNTQCSELRQFGAGHLGAYVGGILVWPLITDHLFPALLDTPVPGP